MHRAKYDEIGTSSSSWATTVSSSSRALSSVRGTCFGAYNKFRFRNNAKMTSLPQILLQPHGVFSFPFPFGPSVVHRFLPVLKGKQQTSKESEENIFFCLFLISPNSVSARFRFPTTSDSAMSTKCGQLTQS